MKDIGISKACSEDWNGMTPTEQGAFCQKCAVDVHDFTNKTSEEIKTELRKQLGQRVCGRILPEQEVLLNAEFSAWQLNTQRSMQRAMTLSLIVVFGLTLFSCSTEREELVIGQIQRVVQEIQLDAPEREVEALPVLVADDQDVLHYQMLEFEIEEKDLEVIYDAVEVSEVKIEKEVHIGMLGGIGYSTVYKDYLEETVPEPEVLEYDANGVLIPKQFDSKVFPNPMSVEGKYELKVPTKGIMVVGLYSFSGQHLRTLHEGELERGTHVFEVNLIDEKPGTYLVIVRSKNYSSSTKFIKL